MTTPVTGAGSAATSTATAQVSSGTGFDSKTFLKLLVAQLQYQDPSNPASSSELMAQTATLAQVQSLDAISTENTQMLTLQRSLSAGALVGQNVSYTDTDGATRSGVVSSVKIGTDTSESQAVIGGVPVDLARISAVSQASSSLTPASPLP